LYPVNYSFTTQSGANLSALVFGDHAAPALNPSVVIDNGQPGYSETGSWSTVVGGFNGTNRIARTVRSGGATATATWAFTGLFARSSYDVYITYAGKSTYSSAAPFTISDGSTTLGTLSLNESILVTQSQGGLNQGSYGGVGWQEAGTFTSSDGNLEVVLTNKATGNFVDADGVLLVAVGAPMVVVGEPTAPTGGNLGGAIGTVSPVTTGGPGSLTNSTSAGKTAAPAISLDGVTQPTAVSVVYGNNLPAQANPTNAVDLILGQNGTSQDVISSLAADVISSKKGKA
jgi:hypothetical protein